MWDQGLVVFSSPCIYLRLTSFLYTFLRLISSLCTFLLLLCFLCIFLLRRRLLGLRLLFLLALLRLSLRHLLRFLLV